MATFIVPGSTALGVSVPNALGVGVSYPLRRSEVGGVGVSLDEDLVREHLQLMFDAEPFELPYEMVDGVGVGVGVRALLFEDVQHIREVLEYRVRASIDAWEPRAQVVGVDVPGVPSSPDSAGLRTVTAVVRYKFRLADGVRSATVAVQVRSSEA